MVQPGRAISHGSNDGNLMDPPTSTNDTRSVRTQFGVAFGRLFDTSSRTIHNTIQQARTPPVDPPVITDNLVSDASSDALSINIDRHLQVLQDELAQAELSTTIGSRDQPTSPPRNISWKQLDTPMQPTSNLFPMTLSLQHTRRNNIASLRSMTKVPKLHRNLPSLVIITSDVNHQQQSLLPTIRSFTTTLEQTKFHF